MFCYLHLSFHQFLHHISCPFQLTAVHLVDSHYCADPAKFISVLCTSLSTMLHVELPHVNVLSKMDLIEQYGKLGKFGDLSLFQTQKNIQLIDIALYSAIKS